MKGGLSVGHRPEILRNVWRRLSNKTVSVGLKWSVKCRVTNSECRCCTLGDINFGLNVSVGWTKWPSVACRKYPLHGPYQRGRGLVICVKYFLYKF